jgi:hypothetical protein
MTTGKTPTARRSFGMRVLCACLLVAAALSLTAAREGACQIVSAPAQTEAARQKELERDAAINLSLAKKSIQDDAFFNARVALNIWKETAIEAGSFDQKVYDELWKQLYEKSIRDNLRCVESAILQRDVSEASMCLKIYRLHAQEVGSFDPAKYQDLQARIRNIRKKEK